MYPKVHLKPQLLRKFQSHKHPWVFSGAIERVEGDVKQLHGELVSVYAGGQFLFSGTFNMTSQISVRAYSWEEHEKIDQAFFERKFLNREEMTAIAAIPPLKTLRAQFVNLINSPIQRLAVALGEVAKKK